MLLVEPLTLTALGWAVVVDTSCVSAGCSRWSLLKDTGRRCSLGTETTPWPYSLQVLPPPHPPFLMTVLPACILRQLCIVQPASDFL